LAHSKCRETLPIQSKARMDWFKNWHFEWWLHLSTSYGQISKNLDIWYNSELPSYEIKCAQYYKL